MLVLKKLVSLTSSYNSVTDNNKKPYFTSCSLDRTLCPLADKQPVHVNVVRTKAIRHEKKMKLTHRKEALQPINICEVYIDYLKKCRVSS